MKDVHHENMKKLFKEKNLAFLCLIGILFLLTGCTKNNEEIVEITFIHGWGTAESDHEAMRQIYMEFEKDHPEIHLNMILYEFAKLHPYLYQNYQHHEKLQDVLPQADTPFLF